MRLLGICFITMRIALLDASHRRREETPPTYLVIIYLAMGKGSSVLVGLKNNPALV